MRTYRTDASCHTKLAPRLSCPIRPSASPDLSADEVLREVAYVLGLTRRVRESMTKSVKPMATGSAAP